MRKYVIFISFFVLAYLLNIGNIYAQEGKQGENVSKAQENVSQVPDEAKAAFDKGIEQYRQGKYDEAIVEFKKAIKLEPNYAKAYCEMGVAYMEKEDFNGAIPNLLKAIEIQHKYPKAHYAVAVAFARKENPDLVNARKHVDIAAKQGYMVVPWFLDYLKRLEEAAK